MSEETFDFVCTTCTEDNKTVEAIKFCVECSGYCCQSCVDAHKFPALRSHNLLDVSQGKKATGQQSSFLELPTERCSIHKAKVIDLYCEGHDVVGCYVCFAKNHKACQDSQIHSIPDMIDTIFKLSDCEQTHGHLKDLLVSMEKVSTSKENKLQSLNKSKKEAMGKVNVFQKSLEAILSKIAASSREEIDVVYKQLETEILNEQHTVDSICKDLKTTYDKLIKSKANRAQRFVCTKMAQGKIRQAGGMKAKEELEHNTDVQITFIPDQSLIDYFQALHQIGRVKKNIQKKHDLYTIKESMNINVNCPDDSMTCGSYGCCLTHANQLLVTDYNNYKLKRIDIQSMSVIDCCTLDSLPVGVCCISKHEVAVACENDKKIQFVSIHNKMTLTRHIKTFHKCCGIAFKNGQLYVTNLSASLYVYDLTGTLLKTILYDNDRKKLFNDSNHVTFNESGDRMFVGGGNKGLVCFDGMGNYLSTINDTDIDDADGVCVDGRGSIFVVGYNSHNVVQFSETEKKLGVVVKQGDGLQRPRSVCFHPGQNIMFVTMAESDVVKMYELE